MRRGVLLDDTGGAKTGPAVAGDQGDVSAAIAAVAWDGPCPTCRVSPLLRPTPVEVLLERLTPLFVGWGGRKTN